MKWHPRQLIPTDRSFYGTYLIANPTPRIERPERLQLDINAVNQQRNVPTCRHSQDLKSSLIRLNNPPLSLAIGKEFGHKIGV
ncbi:hypothetical protein AAZU54_08300 [Pseudomonas sp. Je.1.5.c]|uniref:hypothetical protein n=1 Tax=Pseudomonas sp. Je.1.5.c TaxID=3142839 RepID=UPI003DA7EB85